MAFSSFRFITDKPVVKILTGVRRCGKSTIFRMIKEELMNRDISEEDIIEKRYTEMDIPEDITAQQMYQELIEAIGEKENCYLFLDEIQEVHNWEKAVNSILENGKADIYVTGSNSKLMSSEISTYLTGRFVEIPVFTLSFREYLELRKSVRCRRRNCWKNIFDSEAFRSLHLVNMRKHQHIRS